MPQRWVREAWPDNSSTFRHERESPGSTRRRGFALSVAAGIERAGWVLRECSLVRTGLAGSRAA